MAGVRRVALALLLVLAFGGLVALSGCSWWAPAERADLRITVTEADCARYCPERGEPTATASVTARVENIGTKAAEDFYVELATHGQAAEVQVAKLDPGEEQTLTLGVGPLNSVPCPSSEELTVEVDSRNDVDEDNEQNNVDHETAPCS
jgi:multidrug efflux pump subunit AcrA (membrane-fusion protein)